MTDGTSASGMDRNETVQCRECGLKMWAECNDEMALHERECDGVDDPRSRFEEGDRVELSDFGVSRLGRERRHGHVVGFCAPPNDHCVRVQWDSLESEKRLAHSLVRHEARNDCDVDTETNQGGREEP
jgi:hypothetical protein